MEWRLARQLLLAHGAQLVVLKTKLNALSAKEMTAHGGDRIASDERLKANWARDLHGLSGGLVGIETALLLWWRRVHGICVAVSGVM